MTGFYSKRQMAADKLHWSDCAVHNGPAYSLGPCDCGVAQESVAWVGLTDEEIDKWTPEIHVVIRAVKQLLKGRNS
jgi:hypothetical protein